MRTIQSIALGLLIACGPSSESPPAGASGSAANALGSSSAASASPGASGSSLTSASSASSASSAASAANLASSSSDAPGSSSAASPAASSSAALAAPAAPVEASHLVLKNDPKQGGVLFAKVDKKVGRIEFPGHRAVVSDEGEFPIAFGRNAPKSETMKIHFKDGSVLEHVFQVEQRTFETDKIDGLPPDVVRLDAKDKTASADAEARIEQVRMKPSQKNCYKDGFVWPSVGKVTSRYGQPRVLNGTDGGIHWGVDLAVPNGTPVKAPACGTVVFVEKDIPLAGGTLVIDHGHGLMSTFIHLSAFSKKVGDVVKQGDVVASSGQTGRATGPHLHWGMTFFEVRVDPELLAPPIPTR